MESIGSLSASVSCSGRETKTRKLTPDALVTVDALHEILDISLKKGCSFGNWPEKQAKYELLPVAVQHGEAVGLVICPAQAILLHMVKSNDVIHTFNKDYVFKKADSDSFHKRHFGQMLLDTLTLTSGLIGRLARKPQPQPV